MTRRSRYKPTLTFPFWIKHGDTYLADQLQLLAAVKASSRTEIQFKTLMGVGYHHLTDAFEGKALDVWAASHMEWGLKGNLPSHLRNLD